MCKLKVNWQEQWGMQRIGMTFSGFLYLYGNVILAEIFTAKTLSVVKDQRDGKVKWKFDVELKLNDPKEEDDSNSRRRR